MFYFPFRFFSLRSFLPWISLLPWDDMTLAGNIWRHMHSSTASSIPENSTQLCLLLHSLHFSLFTSISLSLSLSLSSAHPSHTLFSRLFSHWTYFSCTYNFSSSFFLTPPINGETSHIVKTHVISPSFDLYFQFSLFLSVSV